MTLSLWLCNADTSGKKDGGGVLVVEAGRGGRWRQDTTRLKIAPVTPREQTPCVQVPNTLSIDPSCDNVG